jgi:dimethylglycine dehydrogenase
MSGLCRFVAYDKPKFIGREAALDDKARPPEKRLVALKVDSPAADAAGYEPIWLGSRLVGFVTSGGYGHCVGTSLAMGYLESAIPDDQDGLSVTILGDQCQCQVLTEPAVDPAGARMRA